MRCIYSLRSTRYALRPKYYERRKHKDARCPLDLYSLDLSKPPSEMIRKESSKISKCKQGASFKYGGGAYIKETGSLVSYACERNCRDKTVINEF
jgi:hypothetical protein